MGANMLKMKTRLSIFSWTAAGLFLVNSARMAPIQAQPNRSALGTDTTNAPPVPSQHAQPTFVLKPVGVVKEVDKLTQSGADPAVIKAFIQSWPTPYSVSADDILHLHAVGVPSDILTTLIQHGAELVARTAVTAGTRLVADSPNAPIPYPEAAPAMGQPWSYIPPSPDPYAAQAAYPVEVPVYTYPDYPVYSYGYYSGYPGVYFYPGVSVRVGGGYRGHGGAYGGHGGSVRGHGGTFAGRGSSTSGPSNGVHR